MPNRTTSDIFISEELKEILEVFKSKSEIAKKLLNRRLSKDILVENHVNYISVSKLDRTKISYLTPERFNSIENPEEFWTTSKRIAAKPGGFISKIFKDVSDKEIENFVNLYKTFSQKIDFKFKIVKGKEIRKYYYEGNHFKDSGSLGNSCMRYYSCQDYFDLYVDNQMISMLLMVSNDNGEDKILARALLWNLDDVKIMDRIYTIKDDVYYHLMSKWANDNGYYHKTFQNWQNTLSFTNGQKSCEIQISINLTKWDYSVYPYLDTFKWLNMKTGILSNYKPKDFQDKNKSEFRVLNNSSGKYEDGGSLAFCEIDRQWCYFEDCIEKDGHTYNYRHLNYSETLDEFIFKNESMYVVELNDYIYSDMKRNNLEAIRKRMKIVTKLNTQLINDLIDELA